MRKEWILVGLVVLALVGCMLVSGCITTRETRPDGTIIETTRPDTESTISIIVAAGPLADKIITRIDAYNAQQAEMDAAARQAEWEKIQLLLQLNRELRDETPTP